MKSFFSRGSYWMGYDDYRGKSTVVVIWMWGYHNIANIKHILKGSYINYAALF